MSKTTLIILITILIFLSWGHWLFRSFQETRRDDVPSSSTSTEITEYNIVGREFVFYPNIINVKEGERIKIIFNNKGVIPHNLTIEGLDIRTRTLNRGESDILEFVVPAGNSFVFFCSEGINRERGMEGIIEIE